MIEFGAGLDDETCDHLEEALLKMGILDAIVVEEQYKEQVLVPVRDVRIITFLQVNRQKEKACWNVLN